MKKEYSEEVTVQNNCFPGEEDGSFSFDEDYVSQLCKGYIDRMLSFMFLDIDGDETDEELLALLEECLSEELEEETSEPTIEIKPKLFEGTEEKGA